MCLCVYIWTQFFFPFVVPFLLSQLSNLRWLTLCFCLYMIVTEMLFIVVESNIIIQQMNHLGYWSEFRRYLVSLLVIECKWDSIVWFLLLKRDKSYLFASLVVLFKIEKPPVFITLALAKFAHLSMNKSLLLLYITILVVWMLRCLLATCF